VPSEEALWQQHYDSRDDKPTTRQQTTPPAPAQSQAPRTPNAATGPQQPPVENKPIIEKDKE
jgi:hypothetical protein